MNLKIKGYNIFGAVAHAAVLVIVNIILFAFIYKTSRNVPTFWTAYVFFMVANLGLGAATFLIFSQNNDEWLVIPLAYIVFDGLALVYTVLSMIFMCAATIEVKYVWIFELILTAIAAAYITYFLIGARHMNKNTKVIKEKVFYIRDCQAIVNDCAMMSTNADVKPLLKKLADAIRFSDPMSKNNSEQLELELKELLYNMQVAISNDANADVKDAINQAQIVLARRNSLVRMSK